MNEFLNVPNPEEKIKNIVKEALLRKQKEVDRVQNELKSLKQQEDQVFIIHLLIQILSPL